MPYRRKYNNKKKYRKRYNRTKKKWRQQKLSVGTVAKIAKKVCKKTSELKRYQDITQLNAIPVGNPSSTRTIVHCLVGSEKITQGISYNQRIGNTINLVGFNLKMEIQEPLLPMLWSRVVVKVVKFMGPIAPTITATNHADNVFLNQGVLNQATNKQRLSVIWKRTYNFRPRAQIRYDKRTSGIPTDDIGVYKKINPSQYLVDVPRSIIIDKFIKVNKKFKFVSTNNTQGQYNHNYYLMVHAYANKQTTTPANYWDNGETDTLYANSPKFNPHVGFTTTTLYRDP